MSTTPLRWGVLSTANIAAEKLIPAIRRSQSSMVAAVASRDADRARTFAEQHAIPDAYSSYEALLSSPDIDVVYNPLPNHLHVPWTLKAIEAGKHVLCEKPIAMNASEAQRLIEIASRNAGVKVMEAFMYRFHPQWAKARELLQQGAIGALRHIDAIFTYYNRDPRNVRNMAGIGGGGLMDVGCYCVSAARYLSAREPSRVNAKLLVDPEFQVDCHAHGLLDFGDLCASFYCSTQSQPSQRVYVAGERGSLLIDTPFYQPDYGMARLLLTQGGEPQVIDTEACDHYARQVDAFAQAIQTNQAVPTPLADAMANMRVLDALFASDQDGGWVELDAVK